jgi:HPt (histidine-containing phosphotransfer) domain-containing protein
MANPKDTIRRNEGGPVGMPAMAGCGNRETAGLSDGEDESDGREAETVEGQDGRDSATADARGLLVFDRTILDELADMLDDDEELDGYLALLEPTVRPRITTLVRQSAAGEMAGLLVTAHALAGGAACYGLTALSAAARQVEDGARNAQPEAAHRGVAEAVRLAEASLTAVSYWRSNRRPAAGPSPLIKDLAVAS